MAIDKPDKPTKPTVATPVPDGFRILLPDPRQAETIDSLTGRVIGMRSITWNRATTPGSRAPWEDPAPRNDRLDEDEDKPKPSRGPRG